MPETQEERQGQPQKESQAGPDILGRIVATKREEVDRLAQDGEGWRRRAASAPAPRDFHGALGRRTEVALIAEVKRRSPGAGAIRPGLEPALLAASYAASGAAAVSVLTDETYFGGSLHDLAAVRQSVGIPVLRKDFVLDPLQILEARSGGADAVLLIVRILEDEALVELRRLAEDLGMAALVEAHDEEEVRRALDSGARLLGINNRDLTTFATRLETTLDLTSRIPDDVLLVSESGIHTRSDVERLGEASVDAILVGEALLRAPEPGEKARTLCGVARRVTPRGGGGVKGR